MTGSVVMITGAGRGIRASIARQPHRQGARLVLTDTDDASLHRVAHELGDNTVACIGCDVTDFEGMQAAADTAVARFGGVDAVVANAGIEQWAPVRTAEPDDFRRVIETNVIGVFNTARAVLPSLIDTPTLREKVQCTGFAKPIVALPLPLRRPLAVDECAAGLVTAIERRARYWPFIGRLSSCEPAP